MGEKGSNLVFFLLCVKGRLELVYDCLRDVTISILWIYMRSLDSRLFFKLRNGMAASFKGKKWFPLEFSAGLPGE